MGEKRAALAGLAGLTGVAAVIGGVLMVAVLVTWAASIGPSGVLTGEGPAVVRLSPTETSSSTDPLEEAKDEEDDRDRLEERYAGDRPWLRRAALVLEVAALLGLLVLLHRGGRRAYEAWDARRRPVPEPDEVDFDVLEQAQRAIGEEMNRDASHQRDLLLEGGDPRNAIVECWHRFERQAADAGLARHPWETSSEFTLRVLDLVEADGHAVATLAAYYREARFSEHEVAEDARAGALAALDGIHRSLPGRIP